MAIARCGNGVTDLKGSFGGVYFHRDKTGLHCCTRPRIVHRRTGSQDSQRRAFMAARSLSKDNRTVSYLMYRYMNGLALLQPPSVIGTVSPNCTGSYFTTGIYNGYDYYISEDEVYFLWWLTGLSWNITTGLGILVPPRWGKVGHPIAGDYEPLPPTTGTATVQINVVPVPLDYQIPHLQEPPA